MFVLFSFFPFVWFQFILISNFASQVVENIYLFVGFFFLKPVSDQVSIFVSQEVGKKLASLSDAGVRVMMTIAPGAKDITSDYSHNTISKTSVLFVSISFIVLMIISLAWLVFYYIQRFRYAHAKERLAVSY